MRPRVKTERRAVTVPISLFPQQVKYATQRSLGLGMSRSGYLQRLIEYDQQNNLIADILHSEAKDAKAKAA